MNVDRYLVSHTPSRESAVAIGVFDGMHLGHKYLMSRLCLEARRSGLSSGVVTFCNHPASVLKPGLNTEYLTPLDDRINMLHKTGVDFVAPIRFDADLSRLPAAEFAGLLKRYLKMSLLVVGDDFAMGRDREGDVSVLSEIGSDIGFNVLVIDSVSDSVGGAIRSTEIRRNLACGKIDEANKSLGRNFTIKGLVVKGYGRGSDLGFPTANLSIQSDMVVPQNGIYVTWAWIEGRRYMSATSIGVRPTFGDNDIAIESHVLDFDQDLYDKEIELEFVSRIREEKKYDSIHELQEQIGRDVQEVRKVLRSGECF